MHQWNPIGGEAFQMPQDEYDDLVGPMLTMLIRGSSATEIEAFLRQRIDDHYGLPRVARHAGPVAAGVMAWWVHQSARNGARGCEYCANDQNLHHHMTQVAADEDQGILLRCPRCGALYEDPVDEDELVRIGDDEASAQYRNALEGRLP